MAATTDSRALHALGLRLRVAREAAGLSGADLARRLGTGWRQPKVSRIERGQQLPTEGDLKAWAAATDVDPGPLISLRGKAAAEYGPWRDRLADAGGPASFQGALAALEHSCTVLLGEYQPALVPGLLQTPAFIREMAAGEEYLAEDGVTPAELGQLIAAKIRRQTILYERGRRIVHVLGEAVLRTRVGRVSVDTMRGQLAHLAETATLPGHELGIVPFEAASPVAPATGFVVYDGDLAVVETLGGRLQIAEPELVGRYSRWLEVLLNAAVTGSAAGELCRHVADEMRD